MTIAFDLGQLKINLLIKYITNSCSKEGFSLNKIPFNKNEYHSCHQISSKMQEYRSNMNIKMPNYEDLEDCGTLKLRISRSLVKGLISKSPILYIKTLNLEIRGKMRVQDKYGVPPFLQQLGKRDNQLENRFGIKSYIFSNALRPVWNESNTTITTINFQRNPWYSMKGEIPNRDMSSGSVCDIPKSIEKENIYTIMTTHSSIKCINKTYPILKQLSITRSVLESPRKKKVKTKNHIKPINPRQISSQKNSY